ncbi:MAG: universal stress protein [Caldilineaceae bacterium]|nr:universal stress protein [Caldilineaceae bacterium]
MEKFAVLVPMDGSEFSRQIFPYLRKFLSEEENRLVLLRVGESPMGRVGTPPRPVTVDITTQMYDTHASLVSAAHPIYASQERQSEIAMFRREMAETIESLEDDGYTVSLEVRFGNPGAEIVEYVANHDIDLVAMTTHSRQGINRLLFGSVTKYVAEHVGVPIMIYRPS